MPIPFVRYRVHDEDYVTFDLSFDAAYWKGQGHAKLTPLKSSRSIYCALDPDHESSPMALDFAVDGEKLELASQEVYAVPRGRALLEEELDHLAPGGWRYGLQWLYLRQEASILPGVDLRAHRCNRCGSAAIRKAPCASCNTECAYCEECLQMGRSKSCTPLYCITVAANSGSMREIPMAWQGQLTCAQRDAAERAVSTALSEAEKLLIWAVCGAGKTEVVFLPIQQALQQGQKVLLATPRKDVVLELYPRLKEAFPTVKTVALHGTSSQKREEADLTVSTTHQTLRFYQKFDLVILDEADAYPYHNNPMLFYAVERARKPAGNLIYLSATPPDSLKKIPYTLIPARYHRHPLAVPQIVLDNKLYQQYHTAYISPVLLELMEFILHHGRQAFFFVPYIEHVEELVRKLVPFYPHVLGTHSRDPQREGKVMKFRQGECSVLVTTTIMERGVTVPKTDVLVVGADAPVFDEASLVQISGRAGRSADDPIGNVVFLAKDKTRAMVQAVKHIKEMNRIARKRGLLDL